MTQTIFYFLIWGVLIFVMMRFGCGAHVMGHGSHGGHGHSGGGDTRVNVPESAIDPVCRMTVAWRDAKTAVYDGSIYYFCSEKCRAQFEASPSTFLSATPAEASHAGGHHG